MNNIDEIRKNKNDTLCLVIGEEVPDIKPNEFCNVELYKRLENSEVALYASLSLPYLINYIELFEVDSQDPRYFMYEGYEKETGGCRYSCMIKPFGKYKGVYRLGLTYPFKIRDIIPLDNQRVLKK